MYVPAACVQVELKGPCKIKSIAVQSAFYLENIVFYFMTKEDASEIICISQDSRIH